MHKHGIGNYKTSVYMCVNVAIFYKQTATNSSLI